MNFRSYLARCQDTLYSHRDLEIEYQDIIITDSDMNFEFYARFPDRSLLIINEEIAIQGKREYRRVSYIFHYQQIDGTLIFRYDNSPHHPQLSTFPAHKHIGGMIVAAEPPDLADVLHEIDTLLYAGTNK